MERLGLSVDDARLRFGNKACLRYIALLKGDDSSYSAKAKSPNLAPFMTQFKTNEILADIYDAVMGTSFIVAKANAKTPASVRAPRPYPRPWRKDESYQRIGRGAIKVSEFDAWYFGGES